MAVQHPAVLLPIDELPGAPDGPLADLTFAAKDLFDVAETPTTAGNPAFAERWGLPSQDAWAVSALKRAGAKLVAKLHTHELAYGMTGINPHYGTPANPHDPSRIPGGSSSGSGVAVASGLVPLALGTDTGGSVRIPASLCGVWGYRPTHGLVPNDGVVPLAPSFDTVGLLANSAKVLNRGARVLLQHVRFAAPTIKQVVLPTDPLEFCAPEAVEATLRVSRSLERLAFSVHETRLHHLAETREAQRILQGAQAYSYHQDWLQRKQPPLGADVRHLLEMASQFTVGEIGSALAAQPRLVQDLGRFLRSGLLLVMPATPSAAPKITELQTAESAMEFRWRTLTLNTLASMLGLPVVTVPAAPAGTLPVGVQLIGPKGSDLLLLDLAQQLASRPLA